MVGAGGQPADGALIMGSRPVDIEVKGIPFPGGGASGGGGPDGAGASPGTIVVDQVPAGRQVVRIGARRHEEVVRQVDVPPGERVDLGVVRLVPNSR